MGLDPISIPAGIVANLATNILKHYAQHLDGTLVGRGLKAIGLLEQTRDDHLREVLEEALRLYFKQYPVYGISGVIDFFHDPVTAQQLGNYIFDHRPIDQQVIEAALVRHLKEHPLSLLLLQKRGGQMERIIPDFLACYRQVLNEHTDVAERAILLTVLDAADNVIGEIRASEERLKAFVTEALQVQSGNMPELPPEQVIGRYRLQKQLTTGTFGTLYLAESQDTRTLVVLKVVSIPEGLRLRYDVFPLGKHLVDLYHPFILQTLDVNLDGRPPYVVTAFAAGGSLAQRIQQNALHAFPFPEALTIITQVGQALAYLHQQHIIHRGVQPASIMFDSTGNALLTGFDLAMLAPTSGHTLQSHQIGATHYMAPEQFSGMISEKSDQYALGCIAYELYTGHRFKQATAQSISQQRFRSSLAPRQFNPALSIQIDKAIIRAVSLNSDHRYATVEAFVTALATS